MANTVFLIEAHIDPEHVARLVTRLKPHPVYIHLDAKTSFSPDWQSIEATFVGQRYPVHWGGYSQVRAELQMLREAVGGEPEAKKFVLLSDACYPIKPVEELCAMFSADGDFNYIRFADMRRSEHLRGQIYRRHYRDPLVASTLANYSKFTRFANKAMCRSIEQIARLIPYHWPLTLVPYFGSTWCALSREAAEHIIESIDLHPEIESAYQKSFAPDEQVFQTIIGNSKYSQKSFGEVMMKERGLYQTANLHIIDKSLRKWFDVDDFEEIRSSDKYFVRKVGTSKSTKLLDRIDAELLRIH
jgi:hypothetical protein